MNFCMIYYVQYYANISCGHHDANNDNKDIPSKTFNQLVISLIYILNNLHVNQHIKFPYCSLDLWGAA